MGIRKLDFEWLLSLDFYVIIQFLNGQRFFESIREFDFLSAYFYYKYYAE